MVATGSTTTCSVNCCRSAFGGRPLRWWLRTRRQRLRDELLEDGDVDIGQAFHIETALADFVSSELIQEGAHVRGLESTQQVEADVAFPR